MRVRLPKSLRIAAISAWARSATLTFSGYSKPSTLADFPVLVKLTPNVGDILEPGVAAVEGILRLEDQQVKLRKKYFGRVSDVVGPVLAARFLQVENRPRFRFRLAGKRELAQLNPFDLVVLLTISNTVQNAIIGDDNSLLGGLLVLARLLGRFGAWRAGAWPWPAIRQLPISTSSMASAGTPARSTAARIASIVSIVSKSANASGGTPSGLGWDSSLMLARTATFQ